MYGRLPHGNRTICDVIKKQFSVVGKKKKSVEGSRVCLALNKQENRLILMYILKKSDTSAELHIYGM